MRHVLTFAIVALAVGCSNPPTAPDGEVAFAIATASAARGSTVRATITNESGEAISVGSLPCKATWERQVGNSWVTSHQKDVCTSTPQSISHRQSLAFDIAVDVLEAGTYRLFTTGRWVDRDNPTDVSLTSNSITVP